jgi:hypothetical protein
VTNYAKMLNEVCQDLAGKINNYAIADNTQTQLMLTKLAMARSLRDYYITEVDTDSKEGGVCS